MSNPEYLGDSVYIDFDGFLLTLTTDNGEGPSNTIHLEPAVYSALVNYVQRLKEQ
ncbi:hypothetical protein LCGC14_2473950 [marine sediment metagenome]|uniref:Uncharacterized protein n=1 Tax=marine sediment metagenome TaxID=412755 RepID=A0A0F9E3E4_9ZZZZ